MKTQNFDVHRWVCTIFSSRFTPSLLGSNIALKTLFISAPNLYEAANVGMQNKWQHRPQVMCVSTSSFKKTRVSFIIFVFLLVSCQH
jgi:hypothetical protein